jgi:hypothetical protein
MNHDHNLQIGSVPNKFQRSLFLWNKNTCYLTNINFISEDKMLWYTYLCENKMFTNKLDPALFGKGKAQEAVWGKESAGIN